VWLVPKTDAAPEDEVYALSLNQEQSKILDDHIKSLSEAKTCYEFFENEKRKNLAGKTILNLGKDISEKYLTEEEIVSDLGVQPLPELSAKEQFENSKPDLNDDEKSVSILFRWINKPFTLPDGSTKHTLYLNWENAQNRITAHIARITSVIDENEKKEKTISNRIKQFFLGKQQKFSEYRSDLDKLRKITYGFIEKAELQEKIARINKIISDVNKDAEQITEEERKARIQENIEAKNGEKASLEAELSTKETEVVKVKDELDCLEKSFAGAKKAVASSGDITVEEIKKQIEARSMAIADIEQKFNESEKNKKLKKEFKKLKKKNENELARLKNLLADANESAENSDTTAKENEKQIEGVNVAKNSAISGIEQKINETKDTKKNLEELKLKHQRLENEADSFRKRISAKTREIESLETQLKNTGGGKDEAQNRGSVLTIMNKPGGKAASNRTDSPQALSVPELDQLPAKGELYQYQGQAYLAIEYWEDYTDGKKEAGRLKAKLCAKGEK
jgi:DNA repair exonuclease SbcCD ATPase subunit